MSRMSDSLDPSVFMSNRKKRRHFDYHILHMSYVRNTHTVIDNVNEIKTKINKKKKKKDENRNMLSSSFDRRRRAVLYVHMYKKTQRHVKIDRVFYVSLGKTGKTQRDTDHEQMCSLLHSEVLREFVRLRT